MKRHKSRKADLLFLADLSLSRAEKGNKRNCRLERKKKTSREGNRAELKQEVVGEDEGKEGEDGG